MIENLIRSKYKEIQTFHVRMAFSATIDEIGIFKIKKVWHLAQTIFRIALARIRTGATILYYPPAGPNKLPMYRDITILLCTRWMFKKTVFHYHAGGVSELYPTLSTTLKTLYRAAYFSADAAILLAQENPRDDHVLKAKRSYIIPYGIHDYATDRMFTRTYPRNPQHILFVGVLCESKGVLVLLSALKQLCKAGHQFTASFLGAFESPEFETKCLAIVQNSRLIEQVTFKGVLTGDIKWKAYEDADVLCFPTFYESETFGLVILEAMQFGLPVISTFWRGVPSIVDNSQTGLLIPTQDSTALALTIQQLLEAPGLVKKLGENGRRKFETNYSKEIFTERMERMFKEVIL
ncbi:glycosyltransferase family 4 protein [Arenicella xantha]|nr:glycosyltransferase family 4 protein [Arenicella xantha]